MVLMILFGLFISYQLIRKILGGSWSIEDLMLAFLILNIGLTFGNSVRLSRLTSDHNYLRNQFGYLAKDFKKHLSCNK